MLKKNIITAFTLLLLCLPAIFPLFKGGFYSMYDDMQVVRVWEMDKCLRDGQIPCRWVPDLGLGYGYPLYIYYAPLPYYIMEGIHLLGISLINSVKAGFILSVIFSALFFYLFSRRFFKQYVSFATTALYIYAPMRAAGIYVRGAMGESWGLVVVPLIFWALENYLAKKSKISGIILSLSLSIFFITHNLTVLIVLPIFLIWVVLRLKFYKVRSQALIDLFQYSLLGVGLSSFFLIPLIYERNLVHVETLTAGYFGYLQHFLSVSQLFVFTHWGYGPSVIGAGDDAFLGIGPIHTLAVITGLMVLIVKVNKRKLNLALFLFGMMGFLGYAFMSHSKSIFIWQNLSFLEFLQFPWRFLMMPIFISSFFAGFALNQSKGKFLIFSSLATIFIILIFYSRMFKPKDWFFINDSEKLSGENLKRQLTASIYDYLPKSASRAPDDVAPEGLIPLTGEINLKSSIKGSNWFKYDLIVESGMAELALPAYSFPVWKISANDTDIPYTNSGTLGLPKFDLTKGHYVVYASLNNSFPRTAGDMVSIVSLVSMFLIIINNILYNNVQENPALQAGGELNSDKSSSLGKPPSLTRGRTS
ncbi:hypothetical protein A3A76_03810 [Candidatus Woesebacteria bacterium RIFCSPLOWO2_01_FULL_39_23]|uniref:Membrane protein 6-pyruvoyl-tetrahydropterin synthase-related domain-containing protein n=1 Tax=Candidatus Woesebacteria bacterium RIFCSPHIGHO2_01_FULL_40_22 TaxID=1802499 RepID=A0A1F7YL19_9BACT|nr:MAG: hypothetical protein A2141_00210 [Candidatus Woesebacteria bacterium RBG_16_40_11]OGM27579.1 MAG: hypothetical protein A2628_02210 [Candidatus Woesebacteria bacterium RIFCSPHIGHO2_01_FULL_40_22]OGM36733.1 MAG: hypothetical protein A3E41_03055 [Candidatus Woesebacteria bacterium RIFCSPHIGHO2_12_FULL_38_9]OGM62753.1 MAG: hypothetical protein A3A76_03810 [Candidatus Woesebacteria bacterium RIFCSPLOWO2_01_FULL_39_23]